MGNLFTGLISLVLGRGGWNGPLDTTRFVSFKGKKSSKIVLDPTVTKLFKKVTVTITPDSDLKAANPSAIVEVDGKLHTLSVLDKPVEFVADRPHEIAIEWVPGENVERFVIPVGGKEVSIETIWPAAATDPDPTPDPDGDGGEGGGGGGL